MITIKRIYETKNENEYYKVFVDRLWPRGISKEKVKWNEWMQDISPSEELRKWFGHESAKWPEFRQRYHEELLHKQEMLNRLKELETRYGHIVLLYSSKDEKQNNAIILREHLEQYK